MLYHILLLLLQIPDQDHNQHATTRSRPKSLITIDTLSCFHGAKSVYGNMRRTEVWQPMQHQAKEGMVIRGWLTGSKYVLYPVLDVRMRVCEEYKR